jgi:hypothetical protein
VVSSFENLKPGIFLMEAYTGFNVSDLGSMATFTLILPPLLRKPNTKIKIRGKAMLKITAEGLLNIERRLAFVMANMAVI